MWTVFAALQAYVATDGSAVGIVVVRGGDAVRDATATLVADAALRVTRERRAAHYNGLSAYTPLQAALSGALTALEISTGIDPASPFVLRLGDAGAAAVAAGCYCPADAGRLATTLFHRLAVMRRSRGGHVWIAGFAPDRPYAWGERAGALCSFASSDGYYGALPPAFAAARPIAPLVPPWAAPGDDECCVCTEAYSDLWPAPAGDSRAPSGRWACRHAVCRACDAAIQHGPNNRCPLCRAPRAVFVQP